MYTVITTRDNEIKHVSNYFDAMQAQGRFEHEKDVAVKQLVHWRSIIDFDVHEEAEKCHEFWRVIELYEITAENHIIQVQIIWTKTPIIYTIKERVFINIKHEWREEVHEDKYVFWSIQNAKQRLYTLHHEEGDVVADLTDRLEVHNIYDANRYDYIKEKENNIWNRKDWDMNEELWVQLRIQDDFTWSYVEYRLYEEKIQ